MKNFSKSLYRDMYIMMIKIRRFEEKLVELYPKQKIRTPVHLCIGQEAIAVGVCLNLKKDDFLFSNHRCHGHSIAKGMDLKSIMAELYGRRTGCCMGKGGSMHLVDPGHGILATTAIVGGNIPLAVGAALASALQKAGKVAVAFFGDGAVDEGAFYEGLNFASLKKLPVIFVCENNFYATNSPQLARHPFDNIPERARPFKIPAVRIDGNDVLDVFEASKNAIRRARTGKGPTLIECRSYRWKAHVGPDSDIELGLRPYEELMGWMERCPIEKYKRFLLQEGLFTDLEMKGFELDIDKEIGEALELAEKSPFPATSELMEFAY